MLVLKIRRLIRVKRNKEVDRIKKDK